MWNSCGIPPFLSSTSTCCCHLIFFIFFISFISHSLVPFIPSRIPSHLKPSSMLTNSSISLFIFYMLFSSHLLHLSHLKFLCSIHPSPHPLPSLTQSLTHQYILISPSLFIFFMLLSCSRLIFDISKSYIPSFHPCLPASPPSRL